MRTAGRPLLRLVTLKPPYRQVLQPVVDYVLMVEQETEFRKICVPVPELAARHWREGPLHNRRAELLKAISLMSGSRRIIAVNIPCCLARE